MESKIQLIFGSAILGTGLIWLFTGRVLTNKWTVIKKSEHPEVYWIVTILTFVAGVICILGTFIAHA